MALLTFLLLFLTASTSLAQTSGHRLKFVFPFGDDAKQRICPVNYRTLDGCCEPPNSLYTYSKRVGCCRPPNLPLTVGANTRCCTPWQPADQSRWGQTESLPCGGYCGAPNVVSSYSGYSACCSNCSDADGVTAFQTTSSVCGTCCSRVPESCGNMGIRVCEEGTGSAYCSLDPDKECSGDGYYVSGSSGEGGFECLLKSTPCPDEGLWNTAGQTWTCPYCFHQSLGIISSYNACLYTGQSANSTCTARVDGTVPSEGLYSCHHSYNRSLVTEYREGQGYVTYEVYSNFRCYRNGSLFKNGSCGDAANFCTQGEGYICNETCRKVASQSNYSCFTAYNTSLVTEYREGQGYVTYEVYSNFRCYRNGSLFKNGSCGNNNNFCIHPGEGYICDSNCSKTIPASLYSCFTGYDKSLVTEYREGQGYVVYEVYTNHRCVRNGLVYHNGACKGTCSSGMGYICTESCMKADFYSCSTGWSNIP